MGLFSKKKNEEVAIDELTPQIKTKLDELAQKGNQFEEEEQYEEAIQAWKEALSLIPEPQQFYSCHWLYLFSKETIRKSTRML